ncbi:ABC transporter permease [Rossellomorea aquimaris]|uniref:ABC transporter permease n=1 Tax=Rossellomorea aquimaris TaxID=189382 RepID=UPI001CD3323C|nr:ABC transporter permease [Rossellomorea aquimaris]MCA1056467.1 ABC transporter permease [Rossellomorea aquimaris]
MMNNIESIWKKRILEYNQELQKYLKYMFNDHLLFVLIFALGGAAFTYNQWVKTLDPTFPAAYIMAALLGLVLAWSPVYTFLKEADAVFLIPLENRLSSYFRKNIWISFLFQSYIQLLILAAMMPMYVAVSGNGFNRFFPLLGLVLGLKVWNLYVRWYILRFQEREVHFIDSSIRFLLTGTLLLLVLSDAHLLMVVAVAIVMAGYLLYFYQTAKRKNIKWDLLIHLEEQRMLLFYRLANMFTDVPKLKGKVYRRKWLDFLVKTAFSQGDTYRHLYLRSLVRTSEYSGLYLRLTLIGAVVIYANQSLVISIMTALLFLYLTGFQLIPLYKRFDYKIWVLIYPLSTELKTTSFKKILLQSMFVQSVFFALPFLIKGMWMESAIELLCGFIFSVLFSQFYSTRRLKRMEENLFL